MFHAVWVLVWQVASDAGQKLIGYHKIDLEFQVWSVFLTREKMQEFPTEGGCRHARKMV